MTHPRPLFDFLIASSRRTGSTLLCDLLSATGSAGRVGERLNPWHLAPALAAGQDGRAAIATAIGHRGDGPAGVKLHFCYWLRLLDHAGAAEILPPKVIRIGRRDRLAQAISLLRARQSDAWSSAAAPRAAPVYHPGLIRGAMDELQAEADGWDAVLARRGIRPLRLDYEDLAQDPNAALARCLDHLGLPVSNAAAPRRQVQRDDLSAEWAARFRRDQMASPGRITAPAPPA